jgi:hypothetical protein
MHCKSEERKRPWAIVMYYLGIYKLTKPTINFSQDTGSPAQIQNQFSRIHYHIRDRLCNTSERYEKNPDNWSYGLQSVISWLPLRRKCSSIIFRRTHNFRVKCDYNLMCYGNTVFPIIAVFLKKYEPVKVLSRTFSSQQSSRNPMTESVGAYFRTFCIYIALRQQPMLQNTLSVHLTD